MNSAAHKCTLTQYTIPFIIKTIVATSLSSGIGFEALQQLLARTRPYRIIFGARNTEAAVQAIERLDYDRTFHTVALLSLDLCDLSKDAKETVGQDKIGYLLFNAGMIKAAVEKQPYTSVFLLAPNESSSVGNIEEQIRAVPEQTASPSTIVPSSFSSSALIGGVASFRATAMSSSCPLGEFTVPADAQYVVTIKHGASFILNGMFIDELPIKLNGELAGTHLACHVCLVKTDLGRKEIMSCKWTMTMRKS
ncbi:hypothetical protein E4U61_003641 [Claviceps capensis]|nr:hypothetical protein E4U61_003641 [Claviceps capensis]